MTIHLNFPHDEPGSFDAGQTVLSDYITQVLAMRRNLSDAVQSLLSSYKAQMRPPANGDDEAEASEAGALSCEVALWRPVHSRAWLQATQARMERVHRDSAAQRKALARTRARLEEARSQRLLAGE